jgi:drug/metabolite transporter (DMT)-like permease
VLSGIVVFREFPNPLALAGIAAIVASGLAIVLLDRRKTLLAAAPVPE